jgi:hypothetical protein
MPSISPFAMIKNSADNGTTQLEDFIHRASLAHICTQEPSGIGKDSWELGFERSEEREMNREQTRVEAYLDLRDKDDWVLVEKTEAVSTEG